MNGKDIMDRSAAYQEDMVRFAQKLIRTPSISGDEKAVAELLLTEMERLGYDEIFRDGMGNVVGVVRGTDVGPAILYNSHMDHVAPGDTANWEGYDPYGGEIDICSVDNQSKTAKEQAQCIHGRAASDVKGGAAVQVYAGGLLAAMKREGQQFKGSLLFSGVVQEEPAEMAGMKFLLDETFPERGLSYDAMVTSEATSLKLYCGHRGRVELLVTVTGRTAHGSAPWLGINAVYKAMPFIEKIKNELDANLPVDPELGRAAATLTIISCSPGALSIVPDQCFLSIDRRLVPGESVENAVQQIQGIIDGLAAADPNFKAGVEVKTATEISYTGTIRQAEKTMAAWKIGRNHPALQAAARALESVGQSVEYGYWDFATDASKTAGIDRKPTFGYSPMQEQYAHTPYDKVRTDYMGQALAGNAAIFLNLSECGSENFAFLK